MTTTQMVWMDVMGGETCHIATYVDRKHGRVLVDDETLGAMIDAVRRGRLFDEETTEGIVESLQQTSRLHFLHDVTELGGGLENWQPVTQ